MSANLLRYWPLLSIFLILALIAAAFFVPLWANKIALLVVILSLSIAAYSVVQKHRKALEGESAGKLILIRNILLELTGILFALLLAGSLGRFVAEALAHQVSDELMKLILGIFIGAAIGLVVGFIFRRAWERLAEIFSGR